MRLPTVSGVLALATVLAPGAALVADEPPFIPQTPLGLKPVRVLADNPLSAAKVELGKQLYFDPRPWVASTG